MRDPKREDFNSETPPGQAPTVRAAKAPTLEVASRMLNGLEAIRQFGINEKHLYLWVQTGALHAVMIGKRWHYPEWELRELSASVKHSLERASKSTLSEAA